MLTKKQEETVIKMIESYRNAKRINELPEGDASEADKAIEVFSYILDRSERITLEDIAKMVSGRTISVITQKFLVLPTEMKLTYLKTISFRNKKHQRITGKISPSVADKDLIYQVMEGDSIKVHPTTGDISIQGLGKTRVLVYTPINTSLTSDIEITVRNPNLRLAAPGKIRLAGKMRIS